MFFYLFIVEGFGFFLIEVVYFDIFSLLVDNKINREIWGSEFLMFKSGEIEDLVVVLSYILSNEESYVIVFYIFKKNRLLGFVYCGLK